mmetsp:Transcript_2124/g.4977  ORF Transcript_2124/g.4977 Transcript_2124/m.4977 type:complete len:1256 (-) Transcript_2124:1026-4793(-)|eukprot:CAMPEP_0174240346 /NCGR_PEP_ID=MMETSP0417-20130205/18447_1 /TAXON_ID=242541 /ORGANISM="Mayorella sp, Strain BSH-02190019" /LENGTH=1255 /DNA_ID=CAMNT_0015319421 /DNA_START=77 /DNA_END=3844 /DNA_ORIENTATION=-
MSEERDALLSELSAEKQAHSRTLAETELLRENVANLSEQVAVLTDYQNITQQALNESKRLHKEALVQIAHARAAKNAHNQESDEEVAYLSTKVSTLQTAFEQERTRRTEAERQASIAQQDALQKCTELQALVQDLQTRLTEEKLTVELNEQVVADLQAKLAAASAAQAEVSRTPAESEEQQNRLAAAQQELTQLSAQNAKLQAALTESRQETAQLQSEFDQKQVADQQLLVELRAELSTAQGEAARAALEAQELQVVREELDRARQMCQELRSENTRLQASPAPPLPDTQPGSGAEDVRAGVKVKRLEKQLELFRAQSITEQRAHMELVNGLRQEIATLEQTIQQSKQSTVNSDRETSDREKEIQQNDELQRMLAQEKAERNALQDQLSVAHSQLVDMRGQLDELTSKYASASKSLAEVTFQREQALADLATLREQQQPSVMAVEKSIADSPTSSVDVARLEELTKALEGAHAQTEHLRSEYDRLQAALDEVTESGSLQTTQLQAELDQMRTVSNQEASRCQRLEETLTLLQKEKSILANQLKEITVELERARQDSQQLVSTSTREEELREEKLRLSAQLEELQVTNSEHVARVETLEQEVVQLGETLQTREVSLTQAQDELKQLQKESTDLSAELVKQQSLVEDTRTELTTLQKIHNELQQQATEAQNTLKTTVESTQKQIDSLQATLETTTRERNDLEVEKNSLEEQIQSLQFQVAADSTRDAIVEELSKKVADYEQRLLRANTQLPRLSRDLEEAQATGITYQQQIHQLEQICQERQEELDLLRTKLAYHVEQISEADTKSNQLTQELDQTRAEHAALTEALRDEHQQALEEVLRTVQEMEEQARRQVADTERLSQRVQQQAEQLVLAERDHKATTREVEELRAQLESWKNKYQSLSEESSTSVYTLRQVQTQLAETQEARSAQEIQMQVEVAALKEQVDSLSDTRETLQSELNAERALLNSLQGKATDLEAENSVLKQKLEQQDVSSSKQFSKEVHQLEEALEKLQEELADEKRKTARLHASLEEQNRLLHESQHNLDVLHSQQRSSPVRSMPSSKTVHLDRSTTASSDQLDLYQEVAAHAQARFNELHLHYVRVSFALDQTQQLLYQTQDMLQQECQQREAEKCAVLEFLLHRVEILSDSNGGGRLLATELVRELATIRNALPFYQSTLPSSPTTYPSTHLSPSFAVSAHSVSTGNRRRQAHQIRQSAGVSSFAHRSESSSPSSQINSSAQLSNAALFAEAKQHYLSSGQ